MEIEKLVLGRLTNNTYLLYKNNKCLIIDPSCNYEEIKKHIKFKISGILVTHHHFDHIGALKEFIDNDNAKVYDIHNLSEGKHNLDEFKFEVIYTKGHSEDSVSYYFYEDNVLFSGDFIFYNSIGRCDLPGGSEAEMIKSIAKIKKYRKDIIIYPGHGKKTTLGYEMKNNVYFGE